MYIEEILQSKVRKLRIAPLNMFKHHVIEEGVGTVCIGKKSDCETYVKMNGSLRPKGNWEVTA